MIKAIIFDCFGVLTTDKWRAFVDGLAPEVDAEAARRLNQKYGAALIDKDEFLRSISLLTGQSPQEIEQLLDNETVKNRELLDYIAELSNKYKIGLLSNVASNWIRDEFLTKQEQDLFDAMIFSFEEGTTKPDPKLFYKALQELQVSPGEAVMVDDIDRYCEAAKELGMKSICYQDFKQFKSSLEKIVSEA